jgi:hypothetical protein
MKRSEGRFARDPGGPPNPRGPGRRAAQRCTTESGPEQRIRADAAQQQYALRGQPNPIEAKAQHSIFSSFPPPPAFSLICDFPTTPQSEAEATAGQPASRERTVTAHHAAACYRLYCSGPAAPTRPPLTRSLRSPHSPFPFQESSTSPAWHHPYATPRLLPAVMLCVGGRAPPRRSVWRGEHKQ